MRCLYLSLKSKANAGKVEAAIQKAADTIPDAKEGPGCCLGHSA